METGISQNTLSIGAGVTSATTKKPSNTLDKDAFLKLLVAQLQSQDPTQSQDPNQMVQQMTSYSSLEQQQNTNKLLLGIQAQNQGIFQSQASNMIGHKVRVPGSTLQLGTAGAKLGVDLTADASSLTVTIKDAQGKTVRTINQGSQAAGPHTIEWDGKDADGGQLPPGNYTAQVSAVDQNGKLVPSTTSCYLQVESVSFLNGTVAILAGGKSYSLGDVTELAL